MNLPRLSLVCCAAVTALAGCAYVKHVPPGQSLSAVLAKKPELVAMPTPVPQPDAQPTVLASNNQAPEPPLPDTEKVADSFTLGNLCMQQQHYQEAIAAYQACLKENPAFGEAWNNLAIAYQNLGQNDKALEAFRKYKVLALH